MKKKNFSKKQMNDFCELLGTPYAPVSKIEPVKEFFSGNSVLMYGLYSRAAYDGARTVICVKKFYK